MWAVHEVKLAHLDNIVRRVLSVKLSDYHGTVMKAADIDSCFPTGRNPLAFRDTTNPIRTWEKPR